MTVINFKIAERFNRAAPIYDSQASLQEQVATRLVHIAQPLLALPQTILDIGTGTGFVVACLRELWPDAFLTGLDQAPHMLRQAEQKVQRLRTIRGDATTIEFTQKFDAVFSSMMLHWLPDPLDVLQRWQEWLSPKGVLCVAVLVEGSFQEWGDLCRIHNVRDGLWKMPKANFAVSFATRSECQTITISYPNALAFLKRLKATGTATPHADHIPLSAAKMRRMLQNAAQPFRVSYEVLYMLKSPQGRV